MNYLIHPDDTGQDNKSVDDIKAMAESDKIQVFLCKHALPLLNEAKSVSIRNDVSIFFLLFFSSDQEYFWSEGARPPVCEPVSCEP